MCAQPAAEAAAAPSPAERGGQVRTPRRPGRDLAGRAAARTRSSSLVFSEPVSFAIYKKKLLFLPCWNYWIKSYFYKFVMNWIMTILRIKFLERKPHMLTISIWSVPN